jgi:hypothetical protein
MTEDAMARVPGLIQNGYRRHLKPVALGGAFAGLVCIDLDRHEFEIAKELFGDRPKAPREAAAKLDEATKKEAPRTRRAASASSRGAHIPRTPKGASSTTSTPSFWRAMTSRAAWPSPLPLGS